MSIIEVDGLGKVFCQPEKREGVSGAIKGLFKRNYIEKQAVASVSFTIEAGELVGFLGPNGAGKTTTIKMLTGIIHPTTGRLSVLGEEPFRRKHNLLRRISLVMGNKMQLWWDLPAWDGFKVLKELYDISDEQFELRTSQLIEMLNLKEHIYRPVRQLSLGERMKCELLASLLHEPDIMFLDEPTLGLDLISQKKIREFLKEINRNRRTTMLLTSHYMQDVQELCERVIVIDHGRIIFDGKLASLEKQYANERHLKLTFEEEIEKADLEKFGEVIEHADGSALLCIPREKVAEITSAALNQLPVVDVAIEEVPIENIIRDLFSTPVQA